MITGAPNCKVVIVVPSGTYRAEPLVEAVRRHHPDWVCLPVWAGDPQLRPLLEGCAWADTADLFDEAHWEHELVAHSPAAAGWMRGLAVVEQLLGVGTGAVPVLLLVAGCVAINGPIDALVPTGAEPAVVVPRWLHPPAAGDDRRPDADDLLDAGRCSPNVMAFGAGGMAMVRWLARRAGAATSARQLGPEVDLAAELFAARRCDHPGIGVGRWRWDSDEPALLDLEGYDAQQPWTLDAHTLRPARVEVVGAALRQAVLAAVAEQVQGEPLPLAAPGGVRIDDTIRDLAADSDERLAPWSRPEEFREWLAAGYWRAAHRRRPDLRAAFPEPEGMGAAAFDGWCRVAALDDGAPLLLGTAAQRLRHVTVAAPLRHDGLNLVGYLTREASLGDVARRLLDALHQAEVPVATIAHQRTQSPELAHPPRIDDEVRFATSLAVVTADQFPTLTLDLGAVVHASQRMIGYWFWELEHVPRQMREVAAGVSEVWAGSRFVTDALAAALSCPVHHVPIPVPEPVVSARERSSFAPLATSGDRFVFTVVFDHLSVTERKNPVGVIEAFRRAFAPGEGPLLVVKTMNAKQRWPQHQRVRLAAEGRDDIVVWDQHLSRADQMAFVQAADCLVSLHRSEGLGLHLAEAMWLGTPVIATRYSGNLDLIDDDCALLIDAELVPVRGGEGVYPPEARWADPDVAQAAAAMRRVVGDPVLADRLRDAGRRRMLDQPSLADTGRHIAALLGLDPPAAAH